MTTLNKIVKLFLTMKFLGIDYGDIRIGLSIAELNIAVPFRVIKSLTMKENVDEIAKIIVSEEIDKVVIGLPLNMDGTEGRRAKKTKALGNVLGKVTGKEIFYQDERLSSIEADKILFEMDLKKSKKNDKSLIDILSAQLILEGYLSSK
ncbi:MAG: Holliday junction resolvase RuvX [Firmicutes bacterium]|nr:Holliday junction resolvase RuvX [Bacillota bacterium]